MGVKGIMLVVAFLFIGVGAIIVIAVNRSPKVPPPENHTGVIALTEVRTTKKQGDYFAILLEGETDTYATHFRLSESPALKSRLLAELKPGDSIQMTTYPKLKGSSSTDLQRVSILSITKGGVQVYDAKEYEGSGIFIRIVATLLGSFIFIVGLGLAFLALRIGGKIDAA